MSESTTLEQTDSVISGNLNLNIFSDKIGDVSPLKENDMHNYCITENH